MTRGEWVTRAENALSSHGFSSPRLEAQLLLSAALDDSRSRLLASLPAPLEDQTRMKADSLLDRRLRDEPLAYILGFREFFGRKFLVGPGVLVPRVETETLVSVALGLPWQSALDVGTGSGCIAITLACERPGAKVTGTDIEESALEIARINRTMAPHVRLIRSDLFRNVGDEQFDLIISNPPYIGEEEDLPNEVRQFEPASALFADYHGLAIYRRIAYEAPPYLTDGGFLVLELGDNRATEVRLIFAEAQWREVTIHNDLDGMPRAIVLKR